MIYLFIIISILNFSSDGVSRFGKASWVGWQDLLNGVHSQSKLVVLFSSMIFSCRPLSPFKSKPLTEKEEAERKTRAQWRAQAALSKAQDKHDSKMAKIEHGSDYHVTSTYKHGAPGEAEYGHIAHHEAQKYWKNEPGLHKFAHAEVSSKLHTDGRVHTTARYHNGGASFSGATVHMFTDAPKPKTERKKVLGIF